MWIIYLVERRVNGLSNLGRTNSRMSHFFSHIVYHAVLVLSRAVLVACVLILSSRTQ
jgi:hypothetical protein